MKDVVENAFSFLLVHVWCVGVISQQTLGAQKTLSHIQRLHEVTAVWGEFTREAVHLRESLDGTGVGEGGHGSLLSIRRCNTSIAFSRYGATLLA